MIAFGESVPGRFCWADLAASDMARATGFYAGLFGWSAHEQPANGGRFTRLRLLDRDVGSLYQLRDRHLADGVPSHWTPYVCVDDVDGAARRATSLGGAVIVRPLDIAGLARIAIVADAGGAPVGLWQSLAPARPRSALA